MSRRCRTSREEAISSNNFEMSISIRKYWGCHIFEMEKQLKLA